MKNAEWMIKQGKNFTDLIYYANHESENYEIIFGSKIIGKVRIGASLKNPVLAWLDMEHKEPILDDAEKRYLSYVIKPFRDRVLYIAKRSIMDRRKEHIYIDLTDDVITLPCFMKGTMYKGMKADKEYTLEELGL